MRKKKVTGYEYCTVTENGDGTIDIDVPPEIVKAMQEPEPTDAEKKEIMGRLLPPAIFDHIFKRDANE